MDLGIAPTAKLTVVYVVVLFYMVTKQSNVTNEPVHAKRYKLA